MKWIFAFCSLKNKQSYFSCYNNGCSGWQRNRMGKPLSPPQIHWKIIWMLKKFHKTTSESWHRTLGTKKGSPFSSKGGHLYLLPPPFLLYQTLWISLDIPGCEEHLGNWLLARSVSLLSLPLIFSWSPLSPSSHFSSLCNSVNLSGCSRLWRAHRDLITG